MVNEVQALFTNLFGLIDAGAKRMIQSYSDVLLVVLVDSTPPKFISFILAQYFAERHGGLPNLVRPDYECL